VPHHIRLVDSLYLGIVIFMDTRPGLPPPPEIEWLLIERATLAGAVGAVFNVVPRQKCF
jgi:hypothetical protein